MSDAGGYKLKEGFTTIDIPTHSERVCHGCKFLNKEPMMRGHNSVTDNYSCRHPDFKDERMLFSGMVGRTIHFNHEGNCKTPDWCPYLNSKK